MLNHAEFFGAGSQFFRFWPNTIQIRRKILVPTPERVDKGVEAFFLKPKWGHVCNTVQLIISNKHRIFFGNPT
jgi:hypothetical protein